MKLTMALTMVVALTVASGDALAAGKKCGNSYIAASKECHKPAPPTKCRDIKTKKFAKCGAPGTDPVPMKAG